MNAHSKIANLLLAKTVECLAANPMLGRFLNAIQLGMSVLDPTEHLGFIRTTIEARKNDSSSPTNPEIVKILEAILQEATQEPVAPPPQTATSAGAPHPPGHHSPEPKKAEARHGDHHGDHHSEPPKPPAHHREAAQLFTTLLCCLSTIWWEPWLALSGLTATVLVAWFLREDGPRDEQPSQGVIGMRISNSFFMAFMAVRALCSENPVHKFLTLALTTAFLWVVFYFPRRTAKTPKTSSSSDEKAKKKADAAKKAQQLADLRDRARALDNTLVAITMFRYFVIVVTLVASIWVGVAVYWFLGVVVSILGGFVTYALLKYHETVFIEHTEWLHENHKHSGSHH